MKICFVDVLGLPFDGSTLEKQGLGGSESAIISISRELAKIGFEVTVYNDCTSNGCKEGLYDGVHYLSLDKVSNCDEYYDILIGSRSVAAFCEDHDKHQTKVNQNVNFEKIFNMSDKKILWMHDTFCDGDNLIQKLIEQKRIDEIFTLSDFHTSYITNCDHGIRRNFEFLKKYIFQTRNGINKHLDWVDVTKKDKNLFVYNASVTKGMIPLVENIWPEIKKRIPNVKLKIIGGYYNFKEDEAPDTQELKWKDLKRVESSSITFTGVITQKEIAKILADASYMIYPAAFPETFGISSLESLYYNTPILTCDFGALEETAIDVACYKIQGAIEPNSLSPYIDASYQEAVFADMVEKAYNTPYLHQQKMHACNQIRDICGWDTVALQWKHHFYRIFNKYLSVEEYRKVSHINNEVKRIFGRRFNNLEDNSIIKKEQKRILVVSPAYNCEKYIQKHIESVAAQDYDNYLHVIINDASTDATEKIAATLKTDKIDIITNHKRSGSAVKNQIEIARNYHDSGDDIIILLDGDDSLVNDPNIFHKYNNLYHDGAEFTYGSCWSEVDDIPLIAQPYPPKIREYKSYRDYKFNWNIPYTHLRTFKYDLIKYEDFEDLKDENGYLKAGGDVALFYKLIEAANPDRVICVPDVVVNYNDKNPLNDYKVNSEEQTKNANKALGNKKMKNILIAIPTDKNIEAETFKSIHSLKVPEGYKTNFQYFYGYKIDQIRNLIVDWSINNNFDYLFCVDHDITFAEDTLEKMIAHDVDMVSGVYRQRLEPQILELYDKEFKNITDIELDGSLVEIGACGFGCVLIKSDVLKKMNYPYFVYHSALDHKDTISEDVDFCKKARQHINIWADTSILCGHIGQKVFEVGNSIIIEDNSILERFKELNAQDLLPQEHKNYLRNIKDLEPKVIYDIGANVLHWSDQAQKVWPDSRIIWFDGTSELSEFYDTRNHEGYCTNILSDKKRNVSFYSNLEHSSGNSYYRENPEYSNKANSLYSVPIVREAYSLDEVVESFDFPAPDLIKIDVQGAELDVLKGAEKTLKSCKDILIELQLKEYNIGGSKAYDVVEYLESLGFKDKAVFRFNSIDMDCHFSRD